MTATFQLVKRYGSGLRDHVRLISKPVAGSVVVAVNGTPAANFTVDTTAGLVTFQAGSIPGVGVEVTAGFEFDVPVRFDTDALVDQPGGLSRRRDSRHSDPGDRAVRAIDPGLQAHLEFGRDDLMPLPGSSKPPNGEVLGFTDHDRDLSFDGVTYEARSGFEPPAACNRRAGYAPGNLEYRRRTLLPNA